MAGVKSGSRSDLFRREGKDWYCSTGLPSDITINVEEISFHLHKFPLLSKSGLLEKLISDKSQEEAIPVIVLPDIPAGVKAFELAAKFCYGAKFEMTATNVVYIRCAADYLQMTEDISEENLIFRAENFLTRVVLPSWKESIKALQACNDVLPHAKRLHIVRRCIDSVAAKSCSDPVLFGWPVTESSGPIQSSGGSVMWNGISSGSKPRNVSSDWWYEDASSLSLPLYKELINAIECRGVSQDVIVGSLGHYARKNLPILKRRQGFSNLSGSFASTGLAAIPTEDEQKCLLEEVEALLPFEKGATSSKLLFGLLRTALILRAGDSCVANLEKRIGMQLEEAALEDLLIPNMSDSVETLYDVECVHRILEHFLAADHEATGASPLIVEGSDYLGSVAAMPITMVAKLIDGYLAEVASDKNMKLAQFWSLAAAIPDCARPLDDGLYRAIDIYLKVHPELTESEREELCRLMDCQKLSLEACTHAAQNERLPLRTVVQVLFFEQLQLRSSIAECFLISDNLDGSRPLGPSASTARENEAMKAGMDDMRARVSELEKECFELKATIERLHRRNGSGGNGGKRGWRFGLGSKTQMCSAKNAPPADDGMRVLEYDDDTGSARASQGKAAQLRRRLRLDD